MTAQIATPAQKRAIHGLLEKTGSTRGKSDLIASFTDNRTEHISDMLFAEADLLIKHLTGMLTSRNVSKANRANDMRRKIIAMGYKIGWTTADGKIDIGRIDNWCLKSPALKKKLNDYSYEELVKVVTQFEKMYINTLKSK